MGHEMNLVDHAQNEKGVEFFFFKYQTASHRVKVLLYESFVSYLLIDYYTHTHTQVLGYHKCTGGGQTQSKNFESC